MTALGRKIKFENPTKEWLIIFLSPFFGGPKRIGIMTKEPSVPEAKTINISAATVTVSAACIVIAAVLGAMLWIMSFTEKEASQAVEAHDKQPYHQGIVPYVDGQLALYHANMNTQFEALNQRLSTIEKNVDRNGSSLQQITQELNSVLIRQAQRQR